MLDFFIYGSQFLDPSHELCVGTTTLQLQDFNLECALGLGRSAFMN